MAFRFHLQVRACGSPAWRSVFIHTWEFLFCRGPTRPPAKSESTEKNIWEIHMFVSTDSDLAGGGRITIFDVTRMTIF